MVTYVVIVLLALAVGTIVLWNLKQGRWNEFKEDEVAVPPPPATRLSPKKKTVAKKPSAKKVVVKKATAKRR